MADTVSPFTLNLIKHFEGYTPRPKWDSKQYSVGYSTRWEPGSPIGTRADHEAALANEAGKVDQWIAKNITVPLTEPQRAALVSFGFNTGEGSLDKLADDINAGDWSTVAARLRSFNKSDGEVNPGLVSRRDLEARMLLGGQAPAAVAANVNDRANDNPIVATATNATPAAKGDQNMEGLLALFGNGAFGAGNAGLPSLASAADGGKSLSGLGGLFGDLSAFGGGDKNGGGDDRLAANAMQSAAQGGEGGLTPTQGPRFDMAKLAQMLKQSPALGAALRQRGGVA